MSSQYRYKQKKCLATKVWEKNYVIKLEYRKISNKSYYNNYKIKYISIKIIIHTNSSY